MSVNFSLSIVASVNDIDAFGHVNNTVYPLWCQRAALAHSEKLGLSLERFRELGVALVLRRAEYDYLQPVREGQAVQINTRLVAFDGGLKLQRHFECVVGPSDIVARGVWQLVCVDINTGRPRKMPAILRGVYSALRTDML